MIELSTVAKHYTYAKSYHKKTESQPPRSGKRSFPLSLTAADRSKFLDIIQNQSDNIAHSHSLFPDFARFLHFLRGLAAASKVNFDRQMLFGA